jgi:hypothetical protein
MVKKKALPFGKASCVCLYITKRSTSLVRVVFGYVLYVSMFSCSDVKLGAFEYNAKIF